MASWMFELTGPQVSREKADLATHLQETEEELQVTHIKHQH